MSRLNLSLLLTLLATSAASCGSQDAGPTCDGDKCDSLDLPDSEIEDTPCDGILTDRSGRNLQKVAGRLSDPLSKLVFRSGDDCPTGFADIARKLRAAGEVDGFSCGGLRTMVVSETAQALGEATNYRAVTALDCEQPDDDGPDTGILFSLFGVQPEGELPDNVEIIAYDNSTGVYNYYETGGGEIHFFGNSKDMLEGAGANGVRRCASCHTGGGLVMKELASPWLHWEGDTDTPGADDLIADNSELLGDHSDGVEMENLVREGNRFWNRTRVAHLAELGNPQRTLRTLFCTEEVNLDTATSFDSGTSEGVADSASLGGGIVHSDFTFANFGFEAEQYDALLRANGQRIEGLPAGHLETVFGLTTVSTSEADNDFARRLVSAEIVDQQFVDAVRLVDFTRAVFSDERCALLEHVPTSLPDEERTPDGLRNAVLASLGDPAEGTPEMELKRNLEHQGEALAARVRRFTDACTERDGTESVAFEKNGSSQTMDVPELLVDYMKVVALGRDLAREMHLFEFPATMPVDDQEVARGTRLHPETCEITTEFVAVAPEPSSAAECAHSACEEGEKLDATCRDPQFPSDPQCVADICEDDPFCCEVGWNQFCVEKVESICGLQCEESDDSEFCAHDVCETGGALESGCLAPDVGFELDSFCVEDVCAEDSFCCEIGWNDSCVELVNTFCNFTCS